MVFYCQQLICLFIEFEHLNIIHRFASTPSTSHYNRVPIDNLTSKILPFVFHFRVFEHLAFPCLCINLYDRVCDPKAIEPPEYKHTLSDHIQRVTLNPVR
jgi:hypothetical protein